MISSLTRIEASPALIITGGGLALALWLMGVRLFWNAPLSWRYKLSWSLLLLLVGAGAGTLLRYDQIIQKFLLALAWVPILAVVDVGLLHSQRGVSFWVRACGFEVCSVFGVALVTRLVENMLYFAPLLQPP